MKRDGATTSIWQSFQGKYNTSELNGTTPYDVIIVGAGITGVTTALLLQKAGKSCLLAEAVSPGFGTTGGTTAHLNTFYDTPYNQMIKNFGEDSARLVAEGAKSAIELIRSNINIYHIDCLFEEKDAYLFSLDEKQNKELEDIVEASQKVGVIMEITKENPFPIPHIQVAKIPEQAQFNPIAYLHGILTAFLEAGGKFVENCRVNEVKEGDLLTVTTSIDIVTAHNLIYATHIPPGVNLLHFRCAPYRSYALGIRLMNDNYPEALGYDMNDPYHYYRTQIVDGKKYLIAGGEDHKTGHHENTEACFRQLESYVRTHFDVETVAFKWSSQYYEPTDGLPYIGHLPGHGKNMYVATGYGGNGMIYGSLSAQVLTDIITTGKSIYQDVFNPNRIKPIAGFSNFVKEAADVVKELVTGMFPPHKLKDLSSLAAGEAKLVKFDGNTMGLYKDEAGQLHAINSACTHIKCSVKWNAAEKSWDCPCHGSRFSYDGKLLTAPAVKDLQKIALGEKVL